MQAIGAIAQLAAGVKPRIELQGPDFDWCYAVPASKSIWFTEFDCGLLTVETSGMLGRSRLTCARALIV